MNWLSQNRVWVLIAAAFLAAHLFGHGGHGSHAGGGCGGGHRHGGSEDEKKQKDAEPSGSPQHRH
jgi:hypothetical protein